MRASPTTEMGHTRHSGPKAPCCPFDQDTWDEGSRGGLLLGGEEKCAASGAVEGLYLHNVEPNEMHTDSMVVIYV